MIDYGSMMHDAMRGLIKRLLQDIADAGNCPAIIIFSSPSTRSTPGADPDWLLDRYPTK